MKSILALLTIVVAASAILPGCPKPPPPPSAQLDYEHELPPGKLALRKITDPRQIPDFTQGFMLDPVNRDALISSIDFSLNYLSKDSSQRYFPYGDISHEHAVASLTHFRNLLTQNYTPQQLDALIRKHYDVYISVGCDNRGTVRFTGYYTPVFNASKTRQGDYQYPLYSLPDDHRVTEKGTVAMEGQSRDAIERGNMLAGKELVYLADPFEAYIVQVQGSAKLNLVDENRKAIFGFAGTNGMEYHSIRNDMVAEGKLPKGQANLQTMIQYFKQHPDEVQQYVSRNPRFVFFQESSDPSPHGCLNEPVTLMRSIATDKDIFPRACMAFMTVGMLPQRDGAAMKIQDYRGFALDQDTGGGIRMAGRADIYMGVGEGAGMLAGRTIQDGKLYYIFLREDASTPATTPEPTAAAVPDTSEPAAE